MHPQIRHNNRESRKNAEAQVQRTSSYLSGNPTYQASGRALLTIPVNQRPLH